MFHVKHSLTRLTEWELPSHGGVAPCRGSDARLNIGTRWGEIASKSFVSSLGRPS